jgi:uncharacterized membrane protein
VSVIVGIRAGVNMRHAKPALRPSEDAHWRFRSLYFNAGDPSLFVPLRSGIGWTLNLGRPRAILFLVMFLVVGIGAPLLILRTLLGE